MGELQAALRAARASSSSGSPGRFAPPGRLPTCSSTTVRPAGTSTAAAGTGGGEGEGAQPFRFAAQTGKLWESFTTDAGAGRGGGAAL